MQKLFNKYLKEIQDEIIRIKKESKEIQTMNNYVKQTSENEILFYNKFRNDTYWIKNFNKKRDLIYTQYRTPKGTLVVKNDGTIEGLIKDCYDEFAVIKRIFMSNDGKNISMVREISRDDDKLIQDIYYKKDGRTVESIKKY